MAMVMVMMMVTMVLMTEMMLVMVQWAVDMSVETAISGIDRKPCYTRITLLTPLLLHMMMMMMVRISGVFSHKGDDDAYDDDEFPILHSYLVIQLWY